eukprot:Blabericola_migrator_1__12243@NODE_762_length_6620_cov_12_758736_g544_i0_p2_GENE_NODE_762_length_6620_cov_12_758736_g544_i0NODE_762_length_6620_cov_12_758736_g544_i0_p2_ORF_typecomplete_len137_score10_69DUF4911/PF16256_5/0_17_NODE_762_length_6620_cov_12_758736_g544_i045544964
MTPNWMTSVTSTCRPFLPTGSDIPSLARPETWVHNPDIAMVQRILEAHERGELVGDLIRSKFPAEEFKYHLAAYLRQRMKLHVRRRKGGLEARLMDTYSQVWKSGVLPSLISTYHKWNGTSAPVRQQSCVRTNNNI